ncbi:hypothetical protein SSCG_01774 [Streptomyces clavuligerus]|nr:hypothetical protein [Streptomyces clavuligerus]EDY48746.1 hypothetical protein SSCG_01774 [Streptomyces clavuligerus]
MDEPAARARRPPAGRRPGRGGDRTTGGLRGVDLARQALVAAPGAARKNAAAPRKPERRTTTVVRRYRPERCTPPARRRQILIFCDGVFSAIHLLWERSVFFSFVNVPSGLIFIWVDFGFLMVIFFYCFFLFCVLFFFFFFSICAVTV